MERRKSCTAVLEVTDKTGELDEKALATLPPILAYQLRPPGREDPVRVIFDDLGPGRAPPVNPNDRKYQAVRCFGRARKGH
jgi:hypothetical protein